MELKFKTILSLFKKINGNSINYTVYAHKTSGLKLSVYSQVRAVISTPIGKCELSWAPSGYSANMNIRGTIYFLEVRSRVDNSYEILWYHNTRLQASRERALSIYHANKGRMQPRNIVAMIARSMNITMSEAGSILHPQGTIHNKDHSASESKSSSAGEQ